MARILLVEDDIAFAKTLEGFLTKHKHVVNLASTREKATACVRDNHFDLLLLDYRLPDGTGLDVLKAARIAGSKGQAIIMTSFNDVRTAVNAMQLGAFNYITKPINPDEFLLVVNEALAANQSESKGEKNSARKSSAISSKFITGTGPVSDKLTTHLSLVSPTDMSVLIVGESGTGKEFVSRSIHVLSKRKNKPFMAIDCGTLTSDMAASELFGHKKGSFTGAINDKRGAFESANGGTIFLDEVGNLSTEVQMKLLRAIQERTIQPVGSNTVVPIDVRIISATNEDLSRAISEGRFREDLFHRLNEFKILVPALRDRKEDLHEFVSHFISEANQELQRNVQKLTDEVWQVLRKYDWPGNLRELRNVIRRIVLLSNSTIADKSTLPEEMFLSLSASKASTTGTDLKSIQKETEKALILKTLEETRYNKSKTARILNIDRKTLYSKMEEYNIG